MLVLQQTCAKLPAQVLTVRKRHVAEWVHCPVYGLLAHQLLIHSLRCRENMLDEQAAGLPWPFEHVNPVHGCLLPSRSPHLWLHLMQARSADNSFGVCIVPAGKPALREYNCIRHTQPEFEPRNLKQM